MPYADFGEKTPLDGGSSKVFALKGQGEKVTIRILAKPYYTGKHFVKTEKGWNIFFCPRIMHQQNCEYCQKFFDIKKQAKEAKQSGDDKAAEALNKEAREYGPTVRFYYPAIIREREEAVLLAVPLSVRLKIDSYVEAGINVLESDFVYTRTEKPGSDYYTLIRLDSKDTKPLTKKEKEAVKETKNWDLEKMLGVVNESSQELTNDEEDLMKTAEEIFDTSGQGTQ